MGFISDPPNQESLSEKPKKPYFFLAVSQMTTRPSSQSIARIHCCALYPTQVMVTKPFYLFLTMVLPQD